jgi:hypothetical protein
MDQMKPPEEPKTQHARFVEKARELGCDESEEAFDEKLKVIARHKPSKQPKLPETPKAKPQEG